MGLFSKLKSVFSKQEEVKESLDNNEIKVTKEQKEELKETEKKTWFILYKLMQAIYCLRKDNVFVLY